MDWSAARGRLASPPFAPLAPALSGLGAHRWPTHEEITAVASQVVTSRGKTVRFVKPREHTDRERRYYELHIAATGEIETRPENWHDLFNALAWVAFPRAKSAINAQHAAILEERGEAEAKRRSPERDALTVFDEGGVVVASSSPDLARLIVDFEWKELFWRRRRELEATTRFLAFGHSLHEKFLDPFIGMIAKTVFVPVDAGFVSLDAREQVRHADDWLASHFSSRANFASAKSMAPMPVLGVPGWHPSTADESFYDDPVHFRKARPKAPGR
ncbi:MAG: DUF3025 domain-containing protein [Usitatibacter sp.]